MTTALSFSILLLVMGPLTGGMLALYGTLKYERYLKLFLSFAGAYLLSLVFTRLIPEVFEVLDPKKGFFVLIGFLFQIFLERFSEGIEHGHLHVHKHLKASVLPLGILLSLGFHSFTEGIPVGAFTDDPKTRYALIFGIVLHEIPATFTLMTLLKGLGLNAKKLLTLLLIYACMSPLGAICSGWINQVIEPEVFNYFMAFVIGTFLHISTTILFESSEHHGFPTSKLLAIISGITLALLVGMIGS